VENSIVYLFVWRQSLLASGDPLVPAGTTDTAHTSQFLQDSCSHYLEDRHIPHRSHPAILQQGQCGECRSQGPRSHLTLELVPCVSRVVTAFHDPLLKSSDNYGIRLSSAGSSRNAGSEIKHGTGNTFSFPN
jgi:hypothetical protein